MPFRIKVSLIVLLVLAALIFVVPLLVPIPPAPGARPLAVVAGDADYVEVAGVDLHVVRYASAAAAATGADPAAEVGAGAPLDAADASPTFLLLHDYAFNAHSFDEVGPLLARYGEVVAFDRPGFGLSERPLPEGGSYAAGAGPYTAAAQVELTLGLLDALGAQRAVLVGNGMGGRVALDVALAHPERVQALVLLDTPAYLDEARAAPDWFLNSPQMRRLGPVFLRQLAEGPGEQLLLGAFADPGKVTDEIRARHALTTSVEDWDRALWEISRVGRPSSVEGRLGDVTAPTLVVSGEGDTTQPAADAVRLADELASAELVTLPNCGRVPQLECPTALLDALSEWLQATALAGRR